eukprot:gene12268-18961_t
MPASPREGCLSRGAMLVRVCSWNVGEASCRDSADAWLDSWLLGRGKESSLKGYDRNLAEPDVVVVGLQEVDMTCFAMWLGCCSAFTSSGSNWKRCLDARLKDYTLVADEQLMGLVLLVWIRDSVIQRSKVAVDVRSASSGFLCGLFGNKGATALRLSVLNSRSGQQTHVCFVNSHLAAKDRNTERRNDDHDRISRKIRFKDHPREIQENDYVFWFGDLNYRLEASDEEFVQVCLPSAEKHHIISRSDQLHAQMGTGRVFKDFTEPVITWTPTYKVMKRSGGEYDTRRNPSYCDRILYYTYSSAGDRKESECSAVFSRSIGDIESSTQSPLLGDVELGLHNGTSIDNTMLKELNSTTSGLRMKPTPVLQLPLEHPSLDGHLQSPIICLDYDAPADHG